MDDGLIVSAGIDYISATISKERADSMQWYANCTKYLETIAKEGNELKAASRLGFLGHSVGGCFVGERDSDYFCQISGERAQAGFGVAFGSGVHVSRLDVQCTVRTPAPDPDVAIRAQQAIERSNAKLSEARQRDSILWQSLRKGSTCYVGSRKSDQFGRVYDKERETGDNAYLNCWRYEVELHNRLATKTATLLRLSEYTQPNWAATFTKQWYRARGIHIPIKADAELQALPSADKQLSDVESRLKWLETQVQPAIRRLLKLGLRDTVMTALGLDPENTEEPQ